MERNSEAAPRRTLNAHCALNILSLPFVFLLMLFAIPDLLFMISFAIAATVLLAPPTCTRRIFVLVGAIYVKGSLRCFGDLDTIHPEYNVFLAFVATRLLTCAT